MQLQFDFVSPPKEDVPRDTCPKPRPDARAAAGRDASVLEGELARRTGLTVALTITDNRSNLASFRHGPERDHVRVRLHRMFLSAGNDTVKALAKPVLRHRLILRPQARLSGVDPDTVIEEVLQTVDVPLGR